MNSDDFMANQQAYLSSSYEPFCALEDLACTSIASAFAQ